MMASFRTPVISGRSPPDTGTKATTQCRYYPNCTKPGCEFKHYGQPMCNFGEKCRYINTGCKFIHPLFNRRLPSVDPSFGAHHLPKAVTTSSLSPAQNKVSTTQDQDDDERYENEWRESFNRDNEAFARRLGL